MDTIKQVWEGRAGLARTYWGWGILAGLLWGVVLSFLTPGSLPAILAMLALTAYFTIVNTGIWRSAGRYQGLAIWAVLAKVAAVLGFLTIAALVLTFVLVAGDAARQRMQPVPQQAPVQQSSIDKDGKPCSEITEFLGECKRQP